MLERLVATEDKAGASAVGMAGLETGVKGVGKRVRSPGWELPLLRPPANMPFSLFPYTQDG